jgi:SAM-dependent methyltransferase
MGGFQNVRLEQGDARNLPYQDESFDMVVSRLALHHFSEPQIQLGEMVRVSKPECMVAIIDLVSPEDEDLRNSYNYLERLRDPSHTTALTRTQLLSSMEDAGLSIRLVDMRDISVKFQQWVEMTGTAPDTAATIRGALEQDIEGGQKTGMRPYREAGNLRFLQVWSVVIGMKP